MELWTGALSWCIYFLTPCISTHTHTHTHTYIYIYIYIYKQIYIHVVRIHIYTHIILHVCIFIRFESCRIYVPDLLYDHFKIQVVDCLLLSFTFTLSSAEKAKSPSWQFIFPSEINYWSNLLFVSQNHRKLISASFSRERFLFVPILFGSMFKFWYICIILIGPTFLPSRL